MAGRCRNGGCWSRRWPARSGLGRAEPGRADRGGRTGAALPSGAEIGHVEQRGGRHPIIPPFPATVIEWLVEDGDPVSVGQPLIRLQPEQAS